MTALLLKIAVWFALLGLWIWLSLKNDPNTAAIITFLQLTLAGLTHHLATNLPLPAGAPPAVALDSPVVQPVVKPVMKADYIPSP
jgi:FtsH-binding integral membrane protein